MFINVNILWILYKLVVSFQSDLTLKQELNEPGRFVQHNTEYIIAPSSLVNCWIVLETGQINLELR